MSYPNALEVSAAPNYLLMVQPFTATDDPTVLGIKPIPNIQQKISDMIAKYSAETLDIEDVEWEEPDLEFGELFPLGKGESDVDKGKKFKVSG